MEPTPAFLLDNPELVTPVAPWCVALDNLELGILLLAQPWLASDGLRPADLERQLTRLASELPLGRIYFQRVKRAVSRLEEIGALGADGTGRSRLFAVTPKGFAALILNLQVLREDPTLDGAEFELKRALVAMWNLVLERLAELPDEVLLASESDRFFDEVEELRVFGKPVITLERVTEALDVLKLIVTQQELVEGHLLAARQRLIQARTAAGNFSGLDLSRLADQGFPGAASLLEDAPATLAMVRGLASGALPRLSLEAAVLRYEQYLAYLAGLASLHARELGKVELTTMRSFLAGGRGQH